MITMFCKHRWKAHAKEVYEWQEQEVRPETKYWFVPVWDIVEYRETVEILICEKCGEIKKLIY